MLELRSRIKFTKITADDDYFTARNLNYILQFGVSGKYIMVTYVDPSTSLGHVISSVDSGLSWRNSTTLGGENIDSLPQMNGSAIDLAGDKKIAHSPDLGATWQYYNLQDLGLPVDTKFINLTGDGDRLLTSTFTAKSESPRYLAQFWLREGSKWREILGPKIDKVITSDLYLHGQEVVAVFGDEVAYSLDLGKTWSNYSVGCEAKIRSNAGKWFLTCRDGTIAYLADDKSERVRLGAGRGELAVPYLGSDFVLRMDSFAVSFSFDSGTSWKAVPTSALFATQRFPKRFGDDECASFDRPLTVYDVIGSENKDVFYIATVVFRVIN
jgi:hypothetical protein